MSDLGDGFEVAKELGSMAADEFEVLGEQTPVIGAAIESAYDMGKSNHEDALGNDDAADHYHDRAGYEMLKAVPLVGTALTVTELMNGGVNLARGKGFVDGMEDVRDHVEDLGAMAGIGVMGADHPIPGTGQSPHEAHDGWGSHTDLRHSVEEQERFEDARERRLPKGE